MTELGSPGRQVPHDGLAEGKVQTWSPDRLAEALEDPLALERWSVLTGDACLCVDLQGAQPGSPVDWSRLAELPAITIGLLPESASLHSGLSPLSGLADRVDVQVQTQLDRDRIAQAVATHPLASLALVQLLRHSSELSIHDALTAESLVYGMLQGGPEFAAWLAGYSARPIEEEVGAPLHIEREGELLRVVLDRPQKRNAFSAGLRDAFCEMLVLAQQDPGIRQIELRGAGPSFCSGGDLDEFGTTPDPATAHAIRSTRNPGRLLAPLADRVHARIHGACVGAGIELPAFCGRVTAREGAFFQLPEVGMGLVPGAGGTVSLPRRIGRQRTAWMALTGERVSVERALAWGLIDATESAR